jgi:hypothetical protein
VGCATMQREDGDRRRRLDAMLAAIADQRRATASAELPDLMVRRREIAVAAELLITSYGEGALARAREIEARLKTPFAAAVTRAVIAGLQ